MDETRDNPDAGTKAAYVKPVLRRHGTIKGLTQAYLQGKGPPPDKGPPEGTKYVGNNDFSRSAQGT